MSQRESRPGLKLVITAGSSRLTRLTRNHAKLTQDEPLKDRTFVEIYLKALF
jgi:hypothetical protein